GGLVLRNDCEPLLGLPDRGVIGRAGESVVAARFPFAQRYHRQQNGPASSFSFFVNDRLFSTALCGGLRTHAIGVEYAVAANACGLCSADSTTTYIFLGRWREDLEFYVWNALRRSNDLGPQCSSAFRLFAQPE